MIKAHLYVPPVVNVGNDDSTSLGHSHGTLSHKEEFHCHQICPRYGY